MDRSEEGTADPLRHGVRRAVRIREMTAADVDAVSAVRVRGWQHAYRELMPQAYLDAMSVTADAERRREWYGRKAPEVSDLVAERAGEVIGWAAVGPARDPDVAPGNGELLALYVAPELIGTGVGRALLAAGTADARAKGFPTLYLWVVRGNTLARRFYARAGFVPDGAEEAEEVGGRSVPELRYRRRLTPESAPLASAPGSARPEPAPSESAPPESARPAPGSPPRPGS
ncbi:MULTISPECIES: GNAT family N-acetyltransferase [Streptomyces]|uniref:GNAT family N-acetyltransferase n=1 Tax=Streptomyces TaxID=1883 RepID=UPI003332071D